MRIFLTDGYFNLALIPNHAQNATNGLYHFGFQVDDADKATEKIHKLGMSKPPKPRPERIDPTRSSCLRS